MWDVTVMRVLTLTLNPAIDETIRVDRLVRGEVHRARSVRYNAGGKGIDVASCLADWGTEVVAAGFLGAKNDALFERLFKDKGIADRFVRVDEATRVNVTVVDDEGTTDFYLPGLAVGAHDLSMLTAEIGDLAAGGNLAIAALSGSLPSGCPAGIYASMTANLAKKGIKVLLDASGEALSVSMAAPVPPFAIKPNRDELSELVGRKLESMADILSAAREICEQGVVLAVVSMGAEGALFFTRERALVATKTMELHGSTVGAGDAMVAGIAAALLEGGSPERIARLGTAFSVGKLSLFGPNLPEKTVVESLAAEVTLREM